MVLNKENDALEKPIEMSNDTYGNEFVALKRDLEKIRLGLMRPLLIYCSTQELG